MNLACSDPGFVKEMINEVFEPDFNASVEMKEKLPSGWSNTIATIVASQL